MATYVAAATGQTTAAVLGAAPSGVDLKAFGDRVFSLEQNRARIDLANTWTAAQNMLGQTSGATIAAGYAGEYPAVGTGTVSVTYNDTYFQIATLTLQPGIWLVSGGYAVNFVVDTGLKYAQAAITTTAAGSYSPSSAAKAHEMTNMALSTAVSNSGVVVQAPAIYVNISAATTYRLLADISSTNTGNSSSAVGEIRAVRLAQ
jgi:hypothetical protein